LQALRAMEKDGDYNHADDRMMREPDETEYLHPPVDRQGAHRELTNFTEIYQRVCQKNFWEIYQEIYQLEIYQLQGTEFEKDGDRSLEIGHCISE
jgi:hypothetical protein